MTSFEALKYRAFLSYSHRDSRPVGQGTRWRPYRAFLPKLDSPSFRLLDKLPGQDMALPASER
jgi:hypothetical protein